MTESTDESPRPHDVLAAEEFGMPASDAALRPVTPPDEPYPAVEAHDVLAAEEFAMPAGRVAADVDGDGRRGGPRVLAAAAGAVAAAVALLWRKRH